MKKNLKKASAVALTGLALIAASSFGTGCATNQNRNLYVYDSQTNTYIELKKYEERENKTGFAEKAKTAGKYTAGGIVHGLSMLQYFIFF